MKRTDAMELAEAWGTGVAHRPAEGRVHHALLAAEPALVASMAARDGFTEQTLWDFLTGDPGKIAVHNRLVQLLDSDLVEEIVVGSIRQGFHTPAEMPSRTVQSR